MPTPPTMPTAPPTRLLSGSELRKLLVLRERLRSEVVGKPRRVQEAVLAALEHARRLRRHGRAAPWQVPAMAPAELVREIKWRLDASSLDEVTAAARVLDRARRGARGAR